MKTSYECEIKLLESGGLKAALSSSPFRGHLQFDNEEEHYSCFVEFDTKSSWQLGEQRRVRVYFFWDTLPKDFMGRNFRLYGLHKIGIGKLISERKT